MSLRFPQRLAIHGCFLSKLSEASLCARFLSLDRGWVIIIFGTSTLCTCRDASVLQKAHAAIGEEDDDKMTEKILDIVRGDARRRRLAKQVLFS